MTRALAFAALVIFALGLYAFWWEPASLRYQRSRVEVPNWSSACNPIRVALLADLHVGSPFNGRAKLERIVSLTNATDADLVLLAGDYVIDGVLGGVFVAPERLAKALGKLSGRLGVFAVLGNHDWWLNPNRVRTALEHNGIPVLEDESVTLSDGRCKLSLVGIGDFTEGEHDVAKALSGVTPDTPILAFTHNPDVFVEIPDVVSLTLAGHTHGGQVYIPGIGRPIVPSRYGERYAIGHVVEAGRHLFVSPGLGTSILPVRFLVPPTITVLDIHGTQILDARGAAR